LLDKALYSETMVRVIPMTVSGLLCNVAVALVVGRIGGIYLIGEYFTTWRVKEHI